MTNNEAIKYLMNDWFISLGGQLCVDGDRVERFCEAIGVAVKALQKQMPLTVEEKADIYRICNTIERKCADMMRPGMWERYTRHMECGEVREFAQYYRDMETVYKALTGVELFPQLPKG